MRKTLSKVGSRAAAAVLIWALSACTPSYVGESPLLLGSGGAPQLLPPEQLCRILPGALRISVEIDDKRQSFTAYTQCETEAVVMLGLGTLDVPLFSLRWSGDELLYERNPIYSPVVDPRTVFVDLQLAFMETAMLARLPQSSGLSFAEQSGSRILYQHGRSVLQISRVPREDKAAEILLWYPTRELRIRAMILREQEQ